MAFGYRAALDGLRAVAVLAVIAYHDNYSWARGGFLGVDTFFVLSGFLITTLLVLEFRRRSEIRLSAFWTRRARRLLPALFLVLAFVAIYTQVVVVPWERIRIRNDALASLFYVANWRFIFDGQSYFQLFSAASPLRHMWSLAIEEQYYLLWPLVAYASLRMGRGSTRLLGTICGAGILASLLAMYARFSPDNPTSAYYATDARAHSLLIGALLACVLVARKPAARRAVTILTMLAAAAMVVAFVTADATGSAYYRGGSAVFAVVSAAVIVGALQPGPVSRVLSVAPLVGIGRISYGLYLWHWPINVWLVPSRVHLAETSLNLLRLAATFAAATVSYVLVERPIRERAFRRPQLALMSFAPAAAVVAVVIVVSSAGAEPAPSYLVGTAAPRGAVSASRSSSFAAVSDVSPPDFGWGYGDPLLCGEPRPEESAEAVHAAQRQPSIPLPTTAADQRVLLLGDSTACSLWPGLHAVADVQHIASDQGSVFGCGIAVDEFTSTRNEAVTPNTQRCRPFLDWSLPRALARSQPTVVVWMSTWEKSDLVVDGHTIVAGTAEWDSAINARMDDRLAQFTANGARVVMVTEAAPAPNPAQGTESFDRGADDDGYLRLNALLRRFAARHPDKVSLVDLAARLCPNGPDCPENVDGLHVRPDGRHFTPTSAVWAARLLFSDMFTAS